MTSGRLAVAMNKTLERSKGIPIYENDVEERVANPGTAIGMA